MKYVICRPVDSDVGYSSGKQYLTSAKDYNWQWSDKREDARTFDSFDTARNFAMAFVGDVDVTDG